MVATSSFQYSHQHVLFARKQELTCNQFTSHSFQKSVKKKKKLKEKEIKKRKKRKKGVDVGGRICY